MAIEGKGMGMGMGMGLGLGKGTGTAKEAAAIFRNEGTAFLREGV
jgi:hypothetical protein